MDNRIPVNPSEEIQFGKSMVAADLETLFMYFVYAFNDSSLLGSGNHPLDKYLSTIQTALARISSPNIPTGSGQVATEEVGLRNLCRLARMTYKDDDLVYQLSVLSTQLALLPDGNVCTTKTKSDLLIPVAKYIVGGGMQGFVGTWDNQKYAVQDEISGGIWILFFYVVTLWNLHVSSWLTLLKSTGEFVSDKGSMRGNFKPLNPEDTNTWGSILMAQENASTANLFSLSTSDVDEPLLRGITVIKVDGYEKLMAKLLSPSRFTWRFGRWIEVHPLYFLYCPETNDDGAIYSDWSDNLHLMSNISGGPQYRTFNNTIIEVNESLQNHFFKNKSYGSLKSHFKKTTFGEMPTIPSSGTGGMLAINMAHWEEKALSTDQFYHKFLLDTNNEGHLNFQLRRTFNAYRSFMTIGDISLEDYQFMHAAVATGVWNGSAKTTISTQQWLRPISYFGFSVTKTEDTNYKIDRNIQDHIGNATTNTVFKDLATGLPGWTLYSSSESLDFPISLARTKTLYYYGRAADPFKKLKHTVYDINELDVSKVLPVIRSYFWPVASSVSTIDTSPIPVSAMPEQTSVSDDVNVKKETMPASSPIMVSAKLDDKKKEDKKEDKKT